MTKLSFDEENHRYTYKGYIVPSVTEIIKCINQNQIDEIPDSILSRASDRGTAVHLAIELFLKYKYANIDEKYKNYYDAFLSWYDKYKDEIKNIYSEQIVFHSALNFAGTVDLIVETKYGQRWIIDIKTTRNLNFKYVSVQLSGYKIGFEYDRNLKVNGTKVLWLKNDGSYEFKEGENKNNIFLSCLQLYNYINKED